MVGEKKRPLTGRRAGDAIAGGVELKKVASTDTHVKFLLAVSCYKKCKERFPCSA